MLILVRDDFTSAHKNPLMQPATHDGKASVCFLPCPEGTVCTSQPCAVPCPRVPPCLVVWTSAILTGVSTRFPCLANSV